MVTALLKERGWLGGWLAILAFLVAYTAIVSPEAWLAVAAIGSVVVLLVLSGRDLLRRY